MFVWDTQKLVKRRIFFVKFLMNETEIHPPPFFGFFLDFLGFLVVVFFLTFLVGFVVIDVVNCGVSEQ